MSDTNDPCLEPIEKGPESIAVLVANYVWHQWFMSHMHHVWHQCFMSGTNDPCLTPMKAEQESITVLVANYVSP